MLYRVYIRYAQGARVKAIETSSYSEAVEAMHNTVLGLLDGGSVAEVLFQERDSNDVAWQNTKTAELNRHTTA